MDARTPRHLREIVRGKLSTVELERIEQFAQQGLSVGQIALRLNRHHATINHAMHAKGLKIASNRPPVEYARADGVKVKQFTPDEDAFIEALRVQEYSISEIARMVTARSGHKRAPNAVGMRLKILANKDDGA